MIFALGANGQYDPWVQCVRFEPDCSAGRLCTTQLDFNLHKMYSSVLKYRLQLFGKIFITFKPIYLYPKPPVAIPEIDIKKLKSGLSYHIGTQV